MTPRSGPGGTVGSVSDGPTSQKQPSALPAGGKPPLFRHPGRVAIVGATLFLIVVLIAIAIGSTDTSDLQAIQDVPEEVQAYSPAPGSIVSPTETISVDLRDDLVGEFTVCAPTPEDCTPIPLDQTRVVAPTGQVTFKPTEDTDITEYPAGPVTVRVDYRLQGTTSADAGSFSWSFHVAA